MPPLARLCATLIVSCCLFASGAHAQSARQGKLIFTEKAEPPCALCHTLKDAGAAGEIGPNLDELQPDMQKVQRAVKNGVGNMPPYGDSLSKFEIDSVARYVAGAVKAAK